MIAVQQVQPDIKEASFQQFIQYMRMNWLQGEHIAIAGPTGSGKTTVAQELLMIRAYVCVLAVKNYDDTLEIFKDAGFKVIKKWPPDIKYQKVILWVKPSALGETFTQRQSIYKALNQIYMSGGWCVFFDETGYVGGLLKLTSPLVMLLNQGRSSGISVVTAMTRPKSMVARIPPETFNQCRHILVFRYESEDEIASCAVLVGISKSRMQQYMQQLGEHDFLYCGKKTVIIVRNTKRKGV